ncbi:MAG: OsmC family protein [Anaerolineae bacterium]|nr:OsmC family protein [Anaerolineae bacterium]MDW8098902.1 OsmC family protein [Anaerolineae bacterium]
MKRNNVSLENLERTLETFRADPAQARKTNRVEGVWNLEAGQPQFTARLAFEGGQLTLEADQPTAQGGGGSRPGPMLYCLYGLASCYTATFATVAAMMGVELKGLRVIAESDVNFAPVFGLAEAPIIEGVRLTLHVESDAPRERLEEIERLAIQRCPGVYCIAHAIPFETRLNYQEE